MKIHKRMIIFSIILLILLIANILFLILALNLFPAYGGFSRQILFIKPKENNTNGYFILLDELNSRSQSFDIDWLVHSRGNLDIAPDKQSVSYTVKSYLSDDDIALNISFLERIDQITPETGIFCPVSYREGSNYPDVYTSYIKAKYSGAENPIMATMLYPKNNSDLNQNFPLITNLDANLKRIGAHDYLYYSKQLSSKTFLSPSIVFNGRSFFLRQNNTDSNLIEYFYLQDSNNFIFQNTVNFTSSRILDNILINYSNNSQVSGYIDGGACQVSLYCPFFVETVKLDGLNTTFSHSGSMVTFSITSPCSLVVSSTNQYQRLEEDFLRYSASTGIIPSYNEYNFDLDLLSGLEHPYIFYNQTQLLSLREKVQDPNKPWNSWYSDYLFQNPNLEDILSTDIELYEEDQRHRNFNKLALKFAIENNETCLNKAKQYLYDMSSIPHYSSDIRRSHNVEAYAAVFDMIFANLTSVEQTEISNLLYEHAKPLMKMDLFHRNNHRVVDAGALGIAGLVLKDKEMVDLAIETILDYFYNMNPADGGSFEGYYYISYAIIDMIQFAIGLKRIGGFNFFEDAKFLATLNYIAETLGPLGMPGSFEDCFFHELIQEALLISAAHIYKTNPVLAQHFQYSWEQRQNNTLYPGSVEFGYIKGGLPSFKRILGYDVNQSILAKPYEKRKEVWKESSMAYLRYGDDNGLFMPFSCKNYDQNHPHKDENGFELWAFGAYIVNNPGYPGWGAPYHTWSQSTEGANTLLIKNSDQLQISADGIKSSISSPYFSMVIGNANTIYDDPGSFLYATEFYILIYSCFIMIAVTIIVFVMSFKQKSRNIIKKGKDINKTLDDVHDINKMALIKMAIIHPFKLQRYLYHNDPNSKRGKFVNRIIYLFLIGASITLFLVSCFDVNNTVIYHSQYHEDKYQIVFDLLPILILLIFTVGTFIIGLITFAFLKIYTGTNRIVSNLVLNHREQEIDKKKLKTISTSSFLWMLPVIVFGGSLIFFIVIQDLKDAIHGLWTEINSINDIYELMVFVLNEVIILLGLSALFAIPFFGLNIYTFGYGIEFNTEGKIPQAQGRMISLIGLLIMIVILFLIYIAFLLVFKSLFSLISIEALVS